MSKQVSEGLPAAEGGRRPTGVAGEAAAPDRGRWSSRRNAEVVRGESLDPLSRELGATGSRLARWRDEFLAGGEVALPSREGQAQDEEVQLRSRIGEIRRMSPTGSPSAQRPYGLVRVCRVWEVARSTVYATRGGQVCPLGPTSSSEKRGPLGPRTDMALVEHIRGDLASSPWHGEGHRKVGAAHGPSGHEPASATTGAVATSGVLRVLPGAGGTRPWLVGAAVGGARKLLTWKEHATIVAGLPSERTSTRRSASANSVEL